MTDLREIVSLAILDFAKVVSLAHAIEIPITTEILPKPHRAPSTLPAGRMAVYAFFFNGQALKVGRAGPKTVARYTSQHYNGGAPSTLAGTILDHSQQIRASGITRENAGEWIKMNTDRVNLLLPTESATHTLALLEAFLHVRWKPIFEGRIITAQ